MKELENIHFANEASFRNWLQINHDKSPGIWLVFYKKHTEIECINYHEALDAALCFGWIDSIIKKIDESEYVRKFTPRTDTSKWSELNKRRVDELIKNGKMTETGLKKIDRYLKTGKVNWTYNETRNKIPKELPVPEIMINEFSKNEPALTNLDILSPPNRRYFILWITNAKREVTIKKRLKESIRLLKENKKLGLK